MRLAPVLIKACRIGEYIVGEMVVLVDEEIYLQSCLVAFVIKIVQLFDTSIPGIKSINNTFRQKRGISFAERIEPCIAMSIQRTAVVAKVSIDDGKVQIDDEILVVVGRRVLPNIEISIELLELIGCIDVVIVVKHRHG